MGNNYFASVQVLRGVAAMMVVVYHLQSTMGFGETPMLAGGVDLFFVISGFVMVVATRNRRDDPAGFMRHRLLRIVPLYWVATGILVVILLASASRGVVWSEVLLSLFFVAYYDAAAGWVQPVLNVGWTLNLEIVFYLVFAATMFLSVWRQVALIGVLFVGAVAARVVLDPPVESVLFFYTTPMLLEFVAGAALGAAVGRLQQVNEMVGIALVVIAVVLAIVLGMRPELPRTLGQGVPSVVLLAGAVIAEHHFRSRALWAPRLIGDSSYSLYLMHPLVLLLLVPVVIGLPAVVSVPVLLVTCVAAGLASYWYIEQPFARLFRRKPIPATA